MSINTYFLEVLNQPGLILFVSGVNSTIPPTTTHSSLEQLGDSHLSRQANVQGFANAGQTAQAGFSLPVQAEANAVAALLASDFVTSLVARGHFLLYQQRQQQNADFNRRLGSLNLQTTGKPSRRKTTHKSRLGKVYQASLNAKNLTSYNPAAPDLESPVSWMAQRGNAIEDAFTHADYRGTLGSNGYRLEAPADWREKIISQQVYLKGETRNNYLRNLANLQVKDAKITKALTTPRLLYQGGDLESFKQRYRYVNSQGFEAQLAQDALAVGTHVKQSGYAALNLVNSLDEIILRNRLLQGKQLAKEPLAKQLDSEQLINHKQQNQEQTPRQLTKVGYATEQQKTAQQTASLREAVAKTESLLTTNSTPLSQKLTRAIYQTRNSLEKPQMLTEVDSRGDAAVGFAEVLSASGSASTGATAYRPTKAARAAYRAVQAQTSTQAQAAKTQQGTGQASSNDFKNLQTLNTYGRNQVLSVVDETIYLDQEPTDPNSYVNQALTKAKQQRQAQQSRGHQREYNLCAQGDGSSPQSSLSANSFTTPAENTHESAFEFKDLQKVRHVTQLEKVFNLLEEGAEYAEVAAELEEMSWLDAQVGQAVGSSSSSNSDIFTSSDYDISSTNFPYFPQGYLESLAQRGVATAEDILVPQQLEQRQHSFFGLFSQSLPSYIYLDQGAKFFANSIAIQNQQYIEHLANLEARLDKTIARLAQLLIELKLEWVITGAEFTHLPRLLLAIFPELENLIHESFSFSAAEISDTDDALDAHAKTLQTLLQKQAESQHLAKQTSAMASTGSDSAASLEVFNRTYLPHNDQAKLAAASAHGAAKINPLAVPLSLRLELNLEQLRQVGALWRLCLELSRQNVTRYANALPELASKGYQRFAKVRYLQELRDFVYGLKHLAKDKTIIVNLDLSRLPVDSELLLALLTQIATASGAPGVLATDKLASSAITQEVTLFKVDLDLEQTATDFSQLAQVLAPKPAAGERKPAAGEGKQDAAGFASAVASVPERTTKASGAASNSHLANLPESLRQLLVAKSGNGYRNNSVNNDDSVSNAGQIPGNNYLPSLKRAGVLAYGHSLQARQQAQSLDESASIAYLQASLSRLPSFTQPKLPQTYHSSFAEEASGSENFSAKNFPTVPANNLSRSGFTAADGEEWDDEGLDPISPIAEMYYLAKQVDTEEQVDELTEGYASSTLAGKQKPASWDFPLLERLAQAKAEKQVAPDGDKLAAKDQARQEGKQEGKQEGRQEGKRETKSKGEVSEASGFGLRNWQHQVQDYQFFFLPAQPVASLGARQPQTKTQPLTPSQTPTQPPTHNLGSYAALAWTNLDFLDYRQWLVREHEPMLSLLSASFRVCLVGSETGASVGNSSGIGAGKSAQSQHLQGRSHAGTEQSHNSRQASPHSQLELKCRHYVLSKILAFG